MEGVAGARFIHALRRQFEGVNPRMRLPLAVSNRLPMYTMGSVRPRLLRLAGISVGAGTGIGGSVHVGGGAEPQRRLSIGGSCFVNDGCRFDVTAPVRLADSVYLGHEVAILSATHELGTADRRAGMTIGAPVTIGDGVWIGARATILGGVTVGAGAVVAAGAVVTCSVRPNTLVGGVPARELRTLDDAR
jgi:maltose O-acetyltransferase